MHIHFEFVFFRCKKGEILFQNAMFLICVRKPHAVSRWIFSHPKLNYVYWGKSTTLKLFRYLLPSQRNQVSRKQKVLDALCIFGEHLTHIQCEIVIARSPWYGLPEWVPSYLDVLGKMDFETETYNSSNTVPKVTSKTNGGPFRIQRDNLNSNFNGSISEPTRNTEALTSTYTSAFLWCFLSFLV